MTTDTLGAVGGGARAAGWSGATFFARQGIQLLSIVLLTRILPPEDFGLLAMASVVTGFILVVRDFGSGAAIIHEENPEQRYLSTLFWLSTVIGVLLACGVALVAPLIARIFDEPSLTWVVQGLSLGLAIGGVGIVSQALMERDLRFRPIAFAEAVSGISGLVVALGAALSGFGVFSLVLQTLVQVATSTVLVVVLAGWRPSAHVDRAAISSAGRFGGPLVGYTSLNYLVRNADNALIGRFLGSAALGYYALAYRLMLFPVQVVNAVANRVLFPVLARLKDDPERRRGAYLTAVVASALLALPIATGLAGAADQVVAVLLGPGWEPAAPVLRLLAIVAAAQVLGATVGPIFLATGRTDRLLIWGVVSAAVILASFIVGLPYGISGVAAAYAVASAALFIPSLWAALTLIELPVAKVLRRLLPVLLAALGVGLVAYMLGEQMEGVPAVVVLATQIGVASVAYVSVLAVLDRPSLALAAGTWRQILAR